MARLLYLANRVGKKNEGQVGKKIARKSKNSCSARGGEVGAEGMMTKSAMLRSPEIKYKRSKIIFSVTSIALTCTPFCTKLLKISAQFLIGSPGTLMMMIAFVTIKSTLVPLIEGLCAQI